MYKWNIGTEISSESRKESSMSVKSFILAMAVIAASAQAFAERNYEDNSDANRFLCF